MVMKITTCTINVGGGEGNRNMVMDVLWFVDIFFMLDCPVTAKGEYVEHENGEYEMVSSITDGDVEVYIRKGLVGWFEVEKHEKEGVVIAYENEKTNERKRIGAV